MATRGPYRTLDLATKVEVLKEVDQGGTAKQDIARKYGIKANTLSTFIKNKRSILDAFESEKFKTSRKRMRTGAYPELEEALLIWIREARNNKLPFSGEVVTAKASSLAEMLGINDFAASDGWLTRFKHRHDLIFKSACGEKASLDEETQHLVERMLLSMDNLSQYEVSLLSAINMLARAWSRGKEETIANCFRACGFMENSGDASPCAPVEVQTNELDDGSFRAALGDVRFDEYVAVDSNVDICGPLMNSEIVQMVRPHDCIPKNDDDDDDIGNEPPLRAADVAAGIALAQRFFVGEHNAEEAL
ncbi:hypothetical protein HPB51_006978 [Rhipicephalus microplus]|uniref:Tick transposon n=1 Tax=Rhipicephalus microplus TaxID=6941 RepID=A0A9J6ES40_RHIMP|nr:hypothetical protein HPB51_006978 [Rhipicephalus microplus]